MFRTTQRNWGKIILLRFGDFLACRQGTDFHNHGLDVATTVFCDELVISDITIMYQGLVCTWR